MSLDDPWLPQRLDAMLAVGAAEAAIFDAVRKSLTAWLRVARAEVLNDGLVAAGVPDPAGLARAHRALMEALSRYLEPELDAAFGEAFRRAAREADISDLAYRERFVAEAIGRVKAVEPLTYERIRALTAEGIRQGYSMQTIAEGIEQVLTLDGKSPLWTMYRAHAASQVDSLNETIALLRAVPYAERGADWQEQLNALMAGREGARKAVAVGRAKQLAEAGEFGLDRALRIARTEVMAAINGGTVSAMAARAAITGERVVKVWLATSDKRTRKSHAAMDGQRAPVEGKFTVAGVQMDYPGDPSAPARLTVNCRCTVLEELEDAQMPALQQALSDAPPPRKPRRKA